MYFVCMYVGTVSMWPPVLTPFCLFYYFSFRLYVALLVVKETAVTLCAVLSPPEESGFIVWERTWSCTASAP